MTAESDILAMVQGDEKLAAKLEKAADRRMAGEVVDLRGFTRAERDVLALRQLWADIGDTLRSRTLHAERRAESSSPTEAPESREVMHGIASTADGGCGCDECAAYRVKAQEREERYFRESQERDARFHANLRKALDEYAFEMHMQWTADLLSAPFALNDGTLVTWGEATVEQHGERVEMFTRNAMANMEGAARHEAALRDLEDAGVSTLNELVASETERSVTRV